MVARESFERLVVLGSGQLTFDCAKIAASLGCQVSVIEYKVTESTVLEKKCSTAGIPYSCLEKQEIFEQLQAIREKTLVVSAASTYLVPEEIIGKENLTIINWHNALLPAHKGRNAESWCIYRGDRETGITWHMLTSSVDGGDILLQERIPLTEEDTALKLYRKQCELGKTSFETLLPALLSGTAVPTKQGQSKTEEMHYSKDRPGGGRLDANQSLEEISRFLRAFDYGALMLMGPMEFEAGEKKYLFSRYKIRERLESDTEGFDGSRYLIIKDNRTVELKNISEA